MMYIFISAPNRRLRDHQGTFFEFPPQINHSRVPTALTWAGMLTTIPFCLSLQMSSPARLSIPSDLYKLDAIENKGLGLVAVAPIPMHSTICDYTGEIITAEVKDRRYLESSHHLRDEVDEAWLQSRTERGQTMTGDYLFQVASDPDLFVDGEDEDVSSFGRFVNHDSEPNCIVKTLPFSVTGEPRCWFVSKRDIAVGEEITISYGPDYWREGDMVT